MIRGFLAGLLLVMVLSGVHLYTHLGVGASVQITEEDRPAYYILFENHLGPYHEISETIDKIEKLAKSSGQDCQLTFGEFLDNPRETDEDRLHSRGGCLSAHPFQNSLPALQTLLIPARRYVVAHFSGSPAIGPWKVYPKVQSYLNEHRLQADGGTLEIYQLINNESIETTYLFPIK